MKFRFIKYTLIVTISWFISMNSNAQEQLPPKEESTNNIQDQNNTTKTNQDINNNKQNDSTSVNPAQESSNNKKVENNNIVNNDNIDNKSPNKILKDKEQTKNQPEPETKKVNETKEVKETKIEEKEKIEIKIDDNYNPESLMLSDDELRKLNKALSSLINNEDYIADDSFDDFAEQEVVVEQQQQSERSFIHLSSLLYLNKEVWVVWINNEKITSDNNDPNNEYYISEISKNKVTITWSLGITKWKIITGKSDQDIPKTNKDNQIVNVFSLRPNQTYILSDNKIIEGKYMPKNYQDSLQDNVEDIKESIDGLLDGGFDFF